MRLLVRALGASVLLAAAGMTLLSACQTNSLDSAAEATRDLEKALHDEVERNSAQARKYDGFTNVFQFSATLLRPALRRTILEYLSAIGRWESSRLQVEKMRLSQEMTTDSTVFLSFFAPNSDHDDLARSQSIWSVELQVGDRRYRGRIKKSPRTLTEDLTIFNSHTRFASAYEVTFSVPATSLEGQPVSFTLSSVVGKTTVKF